MNSVTAHTVRPQGLGAAPGSNAAGSGTAVVGLQWGDEGKGKIIDLLAGQFQAVVRYNGGANAGHSVVIGGKRHALHLLPSGVFHKGVKGVIANGVVVDPWALLKELERLPAAGVTSPNLALSDRAHVVMPYHKDEDAARETLLAGTGGGDKSIGTTRRGIGPAYSDKANRATAIRVGDLLRTDVLRERLGRAAELKARVLHALAPSTPAPDSTSLFDQAISAGEALRPYITDTAYLLNELLASGAELLFEGANATLLDVDHGTFPYVTSSNCSALGIPAGTGVPGRHIRRVIGVMKAYCTRVGAGPFPTELKDATGDRIRERGREYGTTTGRPRRCGWLDLVALRYATMLNGTTGIALMLLDVLSGFETLEVCTAYRMNGRTTDRFTPDAAALAGAQPVMERLPGWSEDISAARSFDDLPQAARRYVEFIEQAAGTPVEIVSVGPDRAQTIQRR